MYKMTVTIKVKKWVFKRAKTKIKDNVQINLDLMNHIKTNLMGKMKNLKLDKTKKYLHNNYLHYHFRMWLMKIKTILKANEELVRN